MPQIDLPTLFFLSTALFALMTGMFFVTWRQDVRQNEAMMWWSFGHGAATAGCVLIGLRGQIPAWASIGAANTAVLMAFGLMLAGMLRFEGRRVHPLFCLGGAALWVAACQIPAFWESFHARVTLVSSLSAAYCFVAGYQVWRGRAAEPLPSRRTAMIALMATGVSHLIRLSLSPSEPVTESFRALSGGWTAFISVQILLQCVLVGYVLLSLVKERGEYRQRQAAEIDALTGVLTRRAFIERAQARLAADPSRGAVSIFDLDRFKAINDTHGHLAGDRVLIDFTEVVRARLGPGDVFGRYGGEEFALFSKEADYVAAWRIADDIRRDFAERVTHHDDLAIVATVSVGIAAVPFVEPDLDRLIASADAGLYAAKQAGRDRVEMVGRPVTDIGHAVA